MSPRRHLPAAALLALCALTLITAPAAAATTTDTAPELAAGAPAGTVVPPAPDCTGFDGSDNLDHLAERYDYAASLGNGSVPDWTDGDVLPIGAHGDCSLAVRNGTAGLTTARVNGSVGVVHATVDVGRDGAFRVVADEWTDTGADGTASRPAIAVENVGRANDARVAVVVRNASGVTHREALTAPSGRFVDLTLYWYRNDSVAVALREPTATPVEPEGWDARFAAPARNTTWGVRLDGRAYLDEVAIGTHDPVADTASDEGDTASDDEADVDGFETPDGEGEGSPAPAPPDFDDTDRSGGGGENDGDGPSGVVLGPIVAGIGGVMYRYAYGITRLQEQIDAIGSTTRASDVEPAEWNVTLTELFGVVVALVGIAWFLVGLGEALG